MKMAVRMLLITLTAIVMCYGDAAALSNPVLSATAVSSSQINLVWADGNNDRTAYYIYRDGQLIRHAQKGAHSYNDDGLRPNTTYCYQVVASTKKSAAASNSSSAATYPVNVIPSRQVAASSDVDFTPPEVAITNLAPGTNFTTAQIVTISASASDNVGVTRVEFYRDGKLVTFDDDVPYTCAWLISSSVNGTHSWTAKAYDAAGNTSTSGVVTITVNIAVADTTPPSVSITSPASGSTYTTTQTVTLTVSASDNTGIAKVEFYDGTTLVATDTASPYTYAWPVSSSGNGTHSWTAKAYDTSGNTAVSAAVSLVVNIGSASAGWNLVSTGGIMDSNTTLYNVWSSDPYHAWIGAYQTGSTGRILYWNGAAWSIAWQGYTIPIDFWGSGPNDVWMVATNCSTWHWDGASWTAVTNPLNSNYGALNAVGGSASNDVWAVGAVDPTTHYGVALHWNGSTWSSVSTGSTLQITAIWSNGPNDVWAVGPGSGILHWNGISWSASVNSQTSQPNLSGVWASASNDVWAVGSLGKVMHWNGSSWANVASGSASDLKGVWGTAANDVWAVGTGGTILHWNGSSWTSAKSPTTNPLNGIYGVSGGAWSVGNGGNVLYNQAP
jgi:hypothetical protein